MASSLSDLQGTLRRFKAARAGSGGFDALPARVVEAVNTIVDYAEMPASATHANTPSPPQPPDAVQRSETTSATPGAVVSSVSSPTAAVAGAGRKRAPSGGAAPSPRLQRQESVKVSGTGPFGLSPQQGQLINALSIYLSCSLYATV